MKSEINRIKLQFENTQLTKAIYHRQGESDAKLQGEIAKINEKISQIAEDQKSISGLIGEHEVAIRTLQRNPI